MTATFTLTGNLESLVGSEVTRSVYVQLTNDVVDTTGNLVFARASVVRAVDGLFSVTLPAWDPTITPYDADEPQFGFRVTVGSQSWPFLPIAAGLSIDLSDVIPAYPNPSPVQLAEMQALALLIGAAADTVEEAQDTLAALSGLSGVQGLLLDDDGVTPYFDPLSVVPPTLLVLLDTDGTPYIAGVPA